MFINAENALLDEIKKESLTESPWNIMNDCYLKLSLIEIGIE